MQKVTNILDLIKSFSKKDDGTYDVTTGDNVEYSIGYQVSFVRPEAFTQLSFQDWDDLTNFFCTYLNSIAHIGVYSGCSEVSFHCIQIEMALKIMEEYNQESILDWKEKMTNPDSIENWLIINRNFDEKMEINYGKILSKIH